MTDKKQTREPSAGASLDAGWHGRTLPTPEQAKERESRVPAEAVYQAIVDINARGQKASRGAIAEVLKIRVATVSDHIHRLKLAGRVRMIYNGVFEATEQLPPDQPITITDLLDCRIKVERGDEVITFTLGEWRRIGELSMGAAVQFSHMKADRDVIERLERLERENRELRDQNRRISTALIEHRIKRKNQRELFDERTEDAIPA